jgi:KaiC/GvpD/RAD55 family RecA-like ATPase
VAERLTTGLAGLDAQLGGGVPAGTVHVVLAEPMNAQELLPYHFAAGGSLLAGGAAFFTPDLEEADVRRGVELAGGRADRLHVVHLPYKDQWAIPDAKAGLRYVVDGFSTLIQQVGWKDAYQQLQRLRKQVHAGRDNLFVIVTAALHSEVERTLLKSWADGVLELGYDRQGFGLYPYLKVVKMRGVPDSARFMLFRETDRGLFMESTRRVN